MKVPSRGRQLCQLLLLPCLPFQSIQTLLLDRVVKSMLTVYNRCVGQVLVRCLFRFIRQLSVIVSGCEALTSSRRVMAVLWGAPRTFSGFVYASFEIICIALTKRSSSSFS